MPIFLDRSLRKALLSKIKEVFAQDETLAGKVRVHEQESFLPEVENQVIITDLHVTNDSLDSGNKVTELSGKVTFAPIGKSQASFISWVQENPQQTQLITQGFYQLTVVSESQNQFKWNVSVDVLERFTEKRNPGRGIQIEVSGLPYLNPRYLEIFQDSEKLTPDVDFGLIGCVIYLRRWAANTSIVYNKVDITGDCTYRELVSQEITFSSLMRPVQLPAETILSTVTVFDLTHRRSLLGWTLSQSGRFTWGKTQFKGTKVLLQYYVNKSLYDWEVPEECCFTLKGSPLTYADGKSSLVVMSNLRGILPASMYGIQGTTLQVYEPLPGESLAIDYRVYKQTLGPVEVTPAAYNDQIIPGLSVTFTDNFTVGDKVVIIKHDRVKPIGAENGGTTRADLSIKVRAVDDHFMERMTSRLFFTFTNAESLYELTNQGISPENALSYARTYEERDGNSEKWIVHTFSLIVHHTWRYMIPYVTDLNATDIVAGFIEATSETGAPTLQDLLLSSTNESWVQDY